MNYLELQFAFLFPNSIFFWLYDMACGILAPWQGIKACNGGGIPNFWTARGVPGTTFQISVIVALFLEAGLFFFLSVISKQILLLR